MKQATKRRNRLLAVGVLAVLVALAVPLASGSAKAVEPVSAYMLVIDWLMGRAGAMAAGIEYLAIDTTQITNLSAAEKADLLGRMRKYNLTVLENTRTELEAKGLVQNLNFPKGLLIIIETRKANPYAMTMHAQIWRGGAAGFGTKSLRMACDHGQWHIVDFGGVFVA